MGRGRPRKDAIKQQMEEIQLAIEQSSANEIIWGKGHSSRNKGGISKTPSGIASLMPGRNLGRDKTTTPTERWPSLPPRRDLSKSLVGNVISQAVNEKVTPQYQPKKQVEKPVELWANLFATNQRAKRGMSFTFIPPKIVDGKKSQEELVDIRERYVRGMPESQSNQGRNERYEYDGICRNS
ncbi:hypothetical protein HAX54_031007 [Datura stramonium]|uniref:Uncharacterized protein n=1 Tax=Datura stramonium TaxID=4076 RepID=A0ABS8RL18_DATST|nr:hypothetical protein [Datura stramonium]